MVHRDHPSTIGRGSRAFVIRREVRGRTMNTALRDLIRLFAEIVVDELLAEQSDGAGAQTSHQLPNAMTVREGNLHDHQDFEKPLLPAHP